MTKKEAYNYGMHNGFTAAMYNDNGQLEDNLIDAAYDAEQGQRDYSPFEFFASGVNRQKNSEELWEDYDRGVTSGINKYVQERKKRK